MKLKTLGIKVVDDTFKVSNDTLRSVCSNCLWSVSSTFQCIIASYVFSRDQWIGLLHLWCGYCERWLNQVLYFCIFDFIQHVFYVPTCIFSVVFWFVCCYQCTWNHSNFLLSKFISLENLWIWFLYCFWLTQQKVQEFVMVLQLFFVFWGFVGGHWWILLRTYPAIFHSLIHVCLYCLMQSHLVWHNNPFKGRWFLGPTLYFTEGGRLSGAKVFDWKDLFLKSPITF